MSKQHFDATAELKTLREHKRICCKQRYQTSRLNKYREELVQLTKAGASYREMALWLRTQKRVHIPHTSVMPYLHKLASLNLGQEANHAKLS